MYNQSWMTHLCEIQTIFLPIIFRVIAASETWLTGDIKSEIVTFVEFRNDRETKSGQGISTLIRH